MITVRWIVQLIWLQWSHNDVFTYESVGKRFSILIFRAPRTFAPSRVPVWKDISATETMMIPDDCTLISANR